MLFIIYFFHNLSQTVKNLKKGFRHPPPSGLSVSLNPRCHTQSGATESKMARLIYRQCSHPITDGQD